MNKKSPVNVRKGLEQSKGKFFLEFLESIFKLRSLSYRNRHERPFKPTVENATHPDDFDARGHEGKGYSLSSIKKCLAKYSGMLHTAYVIHSQDFKIEDGIVYLPLYMTPCL